MNHDEIVRAIRSVLTMLTAEELELVYNTLAEMDYFDEAVYYNDDTNRFELDGNMYSSCSCNSHRCFKCNE